MAKSVAKSSKGKLALPKSLTKATAKKAAPAPAVKTMPKKGVVTTALSLKKGVAVKKDEDAVFVSEFARVKECATCDCFEIMDGDGAFFHRKNDPQRIYLKHDVLKATRVRITVEVLKAE